MSPVKNGIHLSTKGTAKNTIIEKVVHKKKGSHFFSSEDVKYFLNSQRSLRLKGTTNIK